MEEQRSAGHRIGRESLASQTQRVQRRKMARSKLKYHCNNNIRRLAKLSPQTQYHTIFVFLMPLLVGVLQVNDPRGSLKSILEKHLENMLPFLSAIIIYCIAFTADMKYSHLHYRRSSSYSRLFSSIAIISGSLSSVTLLSFFLSRLFRHLVIILWAFVSIIFVICRHADLIRKASIGLYHKFSDIWNRFKGRNSSDEWPLSLV